jgi:hypothetical protein
MKKMLVVTAVLMLVFVLVSGCEATPGVSPLEIPGIPGGGLGSGDVDVPTLPDVLEMLAGPTGWVILGAVLSALFAKWVWYNKQGNIIKRGLILVISMGIAIIARVLVTYVPAWFWEQTAVYWYIVAGVALSWLGSQGWFSTVVKPQREKERVWRVLE